MNKFSTIILRLRQCVIQALKKLTLKFSTVTTTRTPFRHFPYCVCCSWTRRDSNLIYWNSPAIFPRPGTQARRELPCYFSLGVNVVPWVISSPTNCLVYCRSRAIQVTGSCSIGEASFKHGNATNSLELDGFSGMHLLVHLLLLCISRVNAQFR